MGHKDLPEEKRVLIMVEENVLTQLDHLRTHPSVAAALARGDTVLYS